MKESRLKHKSRGIAAEEHGIAKEFITICPQCGGEVALWSGGHVTTCIFCRYRLFEKETTIH